MLASEAFLRSAAEMWMRWMMAMSWQVSVLVAVVFVVSLVARKASARFRYALWCLVLLKLCLPPTFSFVTGIGRWLPAIGSERIESAAVSEMPAPIPAATLRPSDEVTTSPPLELPPASTGVLSPLTLPPHQSTKVHLSRPFVLFAVWLAGVLTFALILGRQYRKMRRYLLTARPVRDERTLRLIDEAKASLRVKTPVRFFESPRLFSPILLGIFRPNIVLPAGTLKGAENRQILPVFLHELAHLKRRDLWVNWVQAILQILYWFHPLVWIANLFIRREREMIVDDMVLVHLKGEREAYGDSLVSILKQAARKRLLAPGYVGIVETKKSLAYRLRRILDANRKLSLRLGWISVGLLIAFALILIPQAGAQKVEPELPEGAQGVETTEKEFSSSLLVAEAKQVERGPEWVVLDSPVAGSKYALQFDGLTDFVEVPDSPSLDLTNSLTLEAWINFDVGGDNNPRIISKGWEVRTGYELAVYGTGEKRRLAFLAKGIGRTYSSTILRAHTWYHVAATYNGTEVTLYINGKQDISRNVTGGDVPFNIPTNNISLNIGRNSQTFNDRYKGLIKEVRVWSVARTEDDIHRDMNRVLTGTEAHLAAYWKLDEGVGVICHDASPNHNHGRLGIWPKPQLLGPKQAVGKGPEWVVSDSPAADSRYALEFDGNDDYVKIPNSPSLDIRGSLTLSAWVKNRGDHDGQIIWRGDGQAHKDPYELHLAEGRMEFRIDRGPGHIRYRVRSKEFVDDLWHFWTGVYDKEAGKIHLYKDGKLGNSTDIQHVIEYSTSSMWNMIGAVDHGNWQHFKGSIDEVRIWNVALSQEEINQNMKRWLTGEESGLVACWSFEEGQGLVARDVTANRNDARLGVWPRPQPPAVLSEVDEAIPEGVVTLGYVDETAEGKRSIAASGHAVLFEHPEKLRFVEAVQIFASRYGYPQPPKEDFHLYLLNEKFQVLAGQVPLRISCIN